jgi:GTP-binding protein Era
MKSGFVAVTGRANAGKSTLINVLVGEKVSIVSPKPQTTRDRILGVYNSQDSQIVFIDTPGLYSSKNLLNAVMQKTTNDSVKEVDAILFLIDAHEGVLEKDKEKLREFVKTNQNTVLVLTKTDITQEALLISAIKELSEVCDKIVPVSARKGKNLKELLKVIKEILPEGDKVFGDDVISDKSEKFMISEIMREKVLLKCEKEIPHGVAILVNKFSYNSKRDIYEINLDIVCEKQNHKAILIGKQGSKIKEISSFARSDMEKFLGKKVFLTTYIKVEEDWRNSARFIKEHGYGGEDNFS